MKIRSLLFKTALSLVLASVITLIVQLVLDIVIPSDVQDKHTLSALLLSFISPVTFSIFMIYTLHIYGGNGESEVCEEYPDKYPGIFRDIPRVIAKEYVILLLIIAIGLLGTLLFLANTHLLHSSILSALSSLLLCTSSLAIAYQSIGGYLLGTLVTAAIYVIVYTLFRFKWRKFM